MIFVPDLHPPKRLTVPPFLTKSIIFSHNSGSPTASMAISSPFPSVVKLRKAFLGSGTSVRLITSSAPPNSLASLNLRGFLPAAITLAPLSLASLTNKRPIGPKPIIPTVCPGLIFNYSAPRTTFARGSVNAASSKVT